jgi:hypothetical protein
MDGPAVRLVHLVLFRWRVERHRARTALLKQELRRLHARLGMEALLHRIAVQAVIERQQLMAW